MADRGDDIRQTAAQCLTLARTTTDPSTRASLIAMAQRLHDMANRPTMDIAPIVQVFNDQQMTKPVAQQQQQVQPARKDE
jgi:hypothetical protein